MWADLRVWAYRGEILILSGRASRRSLLTALALGALRLAACIEDADHADGFKFVALTRIEQQHT